MEINKEAIRKFAAKMVANNAAEKEAATEEAVVVKHDPVSINTPHGAVIIFGHELISKKELVILHKCLTMPIFNAEEPDHGVRVVTFRDDNRPKAIDGSSLLANCVPDIGGVCINLMHTFTIAVEEAIDQPELSLRAAYHRNMVLNFLHEISHLNIMAAGIPIDDDEKLELEVAAEAWALDQMVALAKTTDMEPEHHANSAFLSAQLMDLLKDDESKWAKEQRHMLENSIMWRLQETKEAEGLTLMSFKALCHLMSGDAADSPEWETQTLTDVNNESEIAKAVKGLDPDAVNANTRHIPVSEASSNISENVPFNSDGGDLGFDPNMMDFEEAAQEPVAAPPPQPQAPWEPQLGTVAATETGPVAKTLPETGLTPEQTGALVKGVYFKCYTHIFNQCQRLLNSDIGFQYPEAVSTEAVRLTEQEKQVVVKMDCLDENGRWCPEVGTNNGVRGMITKNTKLPTYKLYVNNNGVEAVRLLLPQNPGKQNAGQYTKTALQARGGTSIMYIMEANDAVASAEGKFKMKIVDDVFVAC